MKRTMQIVELKEVTAQQMADLMGLMKELSERVTMTEEALLNGKRSAKAAQIHLKRRWLLTIAFRGGCLQILNFIDSKNRRLSSLWFLRPMLYPVLGQECIKLIRRSGFDVI